ncbi:MAG: anti-sigma factor [Chloroflexota bacterium]|nr:MAG: hypothetical protein DIU68_09075 [Chloroflexota bacterium]
MTQDDTRTPEEQEEEARSLLPGYAFGITTEEETRQVEALLAQHPELRAELADYRRLSEAMLAATPPQEPPEGALDRLMQAIAEPDAGTAAPEKPDSLWRQIMTPSWRVSPALVAVALVVWLGVVVALAVQINMLRNERSRLLAERQEQDMALALMRASDVRWIKMNDPQEPEASPAFAWLIYSPGERAGVILTNNFPPLDESMAYQLWVAEDGNPISLGLFRVNPDGSGAYIFELPDDITRYERMGITPEPAGGSAGPTAPPVVRLDLERFQS